MRRDRALIFFGWKEKKELRKPFGKFVTIGQAKKTRRRIIAVGDETTLNLINAGITPYLAVCDFKIRRAKITRGERETIKCAFGGASRIYKNAPSTLSVRLLENANNDIKKGGLIRIIGEEDITALAFMLYGDKNHLVLYGQPGVGMVAVKPESKDLKTKIKKLLGRDLAAATLHHKVKRTSE